MNNEMNFTVYFVIFMIGASMASFIFTLAYRIFTEKDIKKLLVKRSHCDNCGYNLQWYDLIPVFSWLGLRGKCRKCEKKINHWYFLSEVFLGINFILPFITYVPWNHFILSVLLYFLASFDILFMKMPKKVVHILLGLSLLYYLYRIAEVFFINYGAYKLPIILGQPVLMRTWIWFFLPLAEALLISAFLYLMNKVKKSFGFGDTLILVLIALWTQRIPFVTLSFFGAVVLGALISIPIIIRNKDWRGKYIPFVPLLYLSFLIVNILLL
jgi:prepilin signal peptidase PulO-like enzyme (type II secretory pathway)